MGEPGVLERRAAAKGEIIVEQGKAGIEAFLIQSGEVTVFTEAEGKRVELARMGPGQIVGEMALVVDASRTATVQALSECNLIVITRQTLNEKLQKSDPTVRALVTMLMKRLAQSNRAQLCRGGDLDNMLDIVPAIYHELHSSLPAAQKKSLESSLLPPMDAFLNAIKDFRRRYEI